MTSAEINECMMFLSAFAPDAAERVLYAETLAYRWTTAMGGNQNQKRAACLVACELQFIVEAMRAERAGGILIRRQGA